MGSWEAQEGRVPVIKTHFRPGQLRPTASLSQRQRKAGNLRNRELYQLVGGTGQDRPGIPGRNQTVEWAIHTGSASGIILCYRGSPSGSGTQQQKDRANCSWQRSSYGWKFTSWSYAGATARPSTTILSSDKNKGRRQLRQCELLRLWIKCVYVSLEGQLGAQWGEVGGGGMDKAWSLGISRSGPQEQTQDGTVSGPVEVEGGSIAGRSRISR